MFKKFTLTLIILILLASLAGCGTASQSNSSSDASNAQGNPSGAITGTVPSEYNQMLPFISSKVADLKLDASANGTTQQLKVGQVMSISLDANPSTGYGWFATCSDPAVIMQMGETEYQQETASPTPIVGAPETAMLYFQAVKAGTATITLDYKRGFEQDVPPTQTLTITVEVK